MKYLLIGFMALFSASVQAQICIFEWDESESFAVTHYNVYKDLELLQGDIAGLSLEAECALGSYTVTAVNKFGIESDHSTELLIKKPSGVTGLTARLK